MTINPSGNVGIGTASPAARLQAGGDTSASQIRVYGGNAGTSSPELQLYGASSDNNWTLRGNHNTDFSIGQGTFGNYGTQLLTLTAVGNGGNLGISYTSPAAKLAVNGTALINTNTDNGVDKLQVSGSASFTNGVNLATTSGKVGIRTTTQTANLTVLGSYSIGGSVPTNWNFISAGRGGVINNNQGFYWDIFGGAAEFSTYDWGTSQPFTMMFQGNGGRLLIGPITDNGVDLLQVNGSIKGAGFNQAYLARTTTYTATTSDYFIDCTTGTFTVNLFTAVGNTGRILIIKNSGTGTITVDPNGSQTIDGATTQSLSTQWSRVHIISDGANWKIISN
jgi:hypothetical protein